MVHDAMTGTLRTLITDGGLLARLKVRPIEQVTVWGRRGQAAEQYRRDMAAAGVPVSVAATAREAVQDAEVVITATSSTGPLIEAGWLARGAHVTAVASGRLAGRTADDELTVADLTGLGIQDAAVAALAARLAAHHGAGRDVPLGDW